MEGRELAYSISEKQIASFFSKVKVSNVYILSLKI